MKSVARECLERMRRALWQSSACFLFRAIACIRVTLYHALLAEEFQLVKVYELVQFASKDLTSTCQINFVLLNSR